MDQRQLWQWSGSGDLVDKWQSSLKVINMSAKLRSSNNQASRLWVQKPLSTPKKRRCDWHGRVIWCGERRETSSPISSRRHHDSYYKRYRRKSNGTRVERYFYVCFYAHIFHSVAGWAIVAQCHKHPAPPAFPFAKRTGFDLWRSLRSAHTTAWCEH